MVNIIKALRTFFQPRAGCSYSFDLEPFCEPTLFSLLALYTAGASRDETGPLLAWLLPVRNGDGSIGLSPEHRTQGTWLTAQFAVVLHYYGASAPLEQAVNWLLRTRSAAVAQDPNVAQDNSLIGWPWVRGTFGWAEPTAWALIALNLQGLAEHPRAVEGRKLLLDRQIPAGGWNYGNREVRGRELLPFGDTTALALIALCGHVPEEAISASLEFLKRTAETVESPYDLAWAVIGLEIYGIDASRAKDRLATVIDSIPSDEANCIHLAMAVIALSGKKVFIP
jgi:hypothetical protein